MCSPRTHASPPVGEKTAVTVAGSALGAHHRGGRTGPAESSRRFESGGRMGVSCARREPRKAVTSPASANRGRGMAKTLQLGQ